MWNCCFVKQSGTSVVLPKLKTADVNSTKHFRLSGFTFVQQCSVFANQPSNSLFYPLMTETQKSPMKKQLFYLWYPYICIHILWNILTFTILDIVNTNIPKFMYIVIYVQDNRTFPKLFQHSYVTLSDPGTVNKYGLFHSLMSSSIPWAKMYYSNIKWNNHSLFSLKCTLKYIYFLKIFDKVLFYLLIKLFRYHCFIKSGNSSWMK